MKPEKMKGVLTAVRRPRGGVSVSHNKNTADMEPVRMPSPERVILPMQQHIGAPCTPTVKVGDSVSVGQVIGDSDKFISAPDPTPLFPARYLPLGNAPCPPARVCRA